MTFLEFELIMADILSATIRTAAILFVIAFLLRRHKKSDDDDNDRDSQFRKMTKHRGKLHERQDE